MVQIEGPRARVAGESAMCAVVAAQRAAPPRGVLSRIVGVSPLTPAAKASYRDALGELIVGDRLEGLGRYWDVLHDIRHADGMIDHLVLGPTGVFTVRTLNADGDDVTLDGDAMRVGGAPSDEVRAARTDARTATRLLSAALGSTVPVSALLVIVRPSRVSRRASPDGVRVVQVGDLPRAITAGTRALTGEAVARVSDVAERAETWDAGAPAGTASDVHREFSLVRERVRHATVVRVLWGSIAFVAVCVFTWAVTATMIAAVVTSR